MPDTTLIALAPEQLEQLAELVADRVAERRTLPALVGVQEVAAHLGVDASWVYESAAKLGARRLGDGPKARLRFSLADVDARLMPCCESRGASVRETAPRAARRLGRRRQLGTSVQLLPVRGQLEPGDGGRAA